MRRPSISMSNSSSRESIGQQCLADAAMKFLSDRDILLFAEPDSESVDVVGGLPWFTLLGTEPFSRSEWSEENRQVTGGPENSGESLRMAN